MKKNILIILFLFILANYVLAEKPSNIVVDKFTVNNTNEIGIKSHRNSIGVNFGSTVFYMLIAPSAFNIVFPNSESDILKLQGNFGLDFTYTYRFNNKTELNIDAGFYALKTYYDNTNTRYNGNTYGIGASLGARFYYNKQNKASGFFLMPKVGGTLFITENNEYIKKTGTYTNMNTYIWDFYVSGEIGFRIDISRSLGINSGVRPYFDISIIDIGYSYNHLLRLVPLPRFAFGILF